VQEEIGLYGARTAAYGLDPHVAIAIDVTPATDYPGGDARRAGKIELGMGAMIARGPTLNKHVTDLLGKAAEEEEIPHAWEIYARTTSTDADEIHFTRAGIPTGLLSIPTRYLHSPTEICALEDIESNIRLIVAFAKRLSRDQSFVR
jgi:endoglucanase